MHETFTCLPPALQRALTGAGFTVPTPIQERAIPLISAGRDVVGIAQTGTGKTAAFVLPLLARLGQPGSAIRALILCPTRELAAQVAESIALFAKHTKLRHAVIFGGVGQGPQVEALTRGVDILVATPGRLQDLHQQGHLHLESVEYFVLDEADRMLDMGFINDIKRITKLLPEQRQTLFFSATMAGTVGQLAHSLLRDPARVEVTAQATPVETIDQNVLFVDREHKIGLLLHLLERAHLEKVLIFTKTKHGADKLCRILKRNRFSAQQIHGNRSQNQRTNALRAFTEGKARCLIATDVAARGIDIDNISHVINYDLPMEPENYVHRIGRTARAGAAGTAYSFCTAEEKYLLKEIERTIGMRIPVLKHEYHSTKAEHAEAKKPAQRPPRPNRRNAPGHEAKRPPRKRREQPRTRRPRR